ncbi:MAG: 50S ribosomal protein L30 [Sandaracinaceae bacterium]|nr:50S ribosomal protein L30 [Sandaracinaceae bacterium]
MKKLKVKQVRSTIGCHSKHREIVKGLGLRGIGSTVVVDNTPSFRGAIKKVIHLLQVEEFDE